MQNRYRVPLIILASGLGGIIATQYMSKRRSQNGHLPEMVGDRLSDAKDVAVNISEKAAETVTGTTRSLAETVALTGKTLAELAATWSKNVSRSLEHRRDLLGERVGETRKVVGKGLHSLSSNVSERVGKTREVLGDTVQTVSHGAVSGVETVTDKVADVRKNLRRRAEQKPPKVRGKVRLIDGEDEINFSDLGLRKQRDVAHTIDTVHEAKRIAYRQIKREGMGGSLLGKLIVPVGLFLFVRYLYQIDKQRGQGLQMGRNQLATTTRQSGQQSQASLETRFQDRDSVQGGVDIETSLSSRSSVERARGLAELYDLPDQPATEPVRDDQIQMNVNNTDVDDLKLIEGIGPVINEHLKDAGIRTFEQLASTDVARLQEILSAGGSRQLNDPETWPEQARLAADGDWERFEELKNNLKAGKRSRA